MSFPDFTFCISCLRIIPELLVFFFFLRNENRLDVLVRISKIREGEWVVEQVIWTTSFYPRASQAWREQVGDLPCPQA